MKLKLEIEPTQQGTIHHSLVRALELAAAMPSLDRAEEVIRAHVSADQWLVGRGGNHVWLAQRTYSDPIRVAMITPRTVGRTWLAGLTIEAAKQDQIERGDIVRCYDFPGLRDDCYCDGVVKEVDVQGDRILTHVTNEVHAGEQQQVSRFEIYSPLGVSSITTSPCVFLIAKRVKAVR